MVVTGIPETVTDEMLEDEVLEIFKYAQVKINRQPLKEAGIQTTIVKVVNRKYADEAVRCGKNLKGNARYGRNTKMYINNSFCPEYGFINYAIRQAYKNKHIVKYKVKNGVNCV